VRNKYHDVSFELMMKPSAEAMNAAAQK